MKAGNALLLTTGVILAGFLFMLSDARAPKYAGITLQSVQLRSAIASGQPVLIEFYADWCVPCRTVGPMVEELSKELQGKAQVVRLNVDQHGTLAHDLGVDELPTFISLKRGREAGRQAGAIDKGAMRSMLGM